MLAYNVRHHNFIVMNDIILYIKIRITSVLKDKDKKIIIKTTRDLMIMIMSLIFKDYA